MILIIALTELCSPQSGGIADRSVLICGKTLMIPASRSILVFGIYSLLMGMVLLFFPERILPVVGLPVSNEPWLNLLGFVLICSSYYYIRSAMSGNRDFASYTTHARFAAPLVVILLIAAGKADWHFLSFGIVDGLGGLWTWLALKQDFNGTYISPTPQRPCNCARSRRPR
jgi:hypothetical protein